MAITPTFFAIVLTDEAKRYRLCLGLAACLIAVCIGGPSFAVRHCVEPHAILFASLSTGALPDASGNLYVADSVDASIRRIDPHGNVQTVSGKLSDEMLIDGPLAQATYWRPRYLRFDHDGRLCVLDDSPYIGRRGARIRRFDFSTRSCGCARR